MFNAVYVVHRIAESLPAVLGISLVFERTSRRGLLLKFYRKTPSPTSAGYSRKSTKNGPRGPCGSHVAVELLLPVVLAVSFTLQGAEALETLARFADEDAALAQLLDQAGLLHLLLEALLKAVIGFVAVLVCVDCHRVRGLYVKENGIASAF